MSRHRTTSTWRRTVLVLASFALVQCDPTPDADVLSVAAPKDYLGSHVAVDGVRKGALAHLVTQNTWFDSLMKRLYPGSPGHDVVVLNIYLPSALKAGTHQVRVVHPSGKVHVGQFAYPFTPGEHYCLLFPTATGLEPSVSCAVTAP